MADDQDAFVATPASQYSNESIVLDQEFAELSGVDRGSPGQSRASRMKSTRFNMMGSISYPEIDAAAQKQSLNAPEPVSLQDRLRSRLYDKPETSGVMQYVKMQTVRKRPVSGVRYVFNLSLLKLIFTVNTLLLFGHLETKCKE